MTRRELAAAVAATAALAQRQAAAQDPLPSDSDLVAERNRRRAEASQTLREFKMDIAVEPATVFKA